jgi:hypothetical protein
MALAHGQQVLFMPVGNMAAIVVVLVMAVRAKVDWQSRVLSVVLAAAVVFPPYFLTNQYFPWWLTSSELGCFVLGFVPPVAAAGLLLGWRGWMKRHASR